MSYNHNQLGKTPYVCSCGIRVHLEVHEKNSWLVRHSEHYPGVEHEITEIESTDPQDKDALMVKVLSQISRKLDNPGAPK